MQQFVRVNKAMLSYQGSPAMPGRSIFALSSPETIASGVLTKVNDAPLKPLVGEVRYLARVQLQPARISHLARGEAQRAN
jgi:hypothetical protein